MPNFNTRFACAEAERGKFTVLTSEELQRFGMTMQTLSASRGRYALLTYQVNSPTLSGATVETQVPNENEVHSFISSPATVYPLVFVNRSSLIEIYNKSTNNIYLYYSATTAQAITANGMVVEPGTYYSIERETSGIWLVSDGSTDSDIRVFNHYTI